MVQLETKIRLNHALLVDGCGTVECGRVRSVA